ncbi:hypothetical protein FisN_8Hh132 [Fistulifera solaris]|uniref:CID domain-containing protein n=1 Tax=Fistulifera solaris TaxID=1519565 RepID=A0A1Z5JY31_FISSO|nr:hypothetical protein FisN_8Hh132 [Fistulifera solaris]|eukprot:GAX18914.1 hypothetical protein FisN_8Hh132 [Fistulifera solaris]
MKVSWANQFEAKLATLGPLSSKETILTVAQWVAFNRKRISHFVPVLEDQLRKQPDLALNLMHEILLMYQNTGRWESMEEVRVALGDQVLLKNVPSHIPAEKLAAWDDLNVFGNPMIVNQLRKKMKEKEASLSAADSSQEVNLGDTATPASPQVVKAAAPIVAKESPLPETASALASTADHVAKESKREEVVYDFESSGIPASAVDATQFQEPCRKIVTLQIARDLRNDSAVQLSSALSGMPEDIRSACAKAAEDPEYTIDAATAKHFSMRISNTLLDTNLEEQLENIKVFRGVVDSQRQARSELIRLLVQSRCNFGADDAAKAFYQADRAKADLQHRKIILLDAMELEGLDVGVDEQGDQAPTSDLAPLDWYKASDDEPPVKRVKVDF